MDGTSTFTQGMVLPDGVSLLCVGIASAQATAPPESAVQCLESLRLRGMRHVVAIDTAVSTALANHAPDWLLAAGVSVCVPGAPGPTGGIIGSPRQEATSAGASSWLPGRRFSVSALPGGPGVVVAGPPALAERSLDGVRPGSHGPDLLNRMEETFAHMGVSVGLLVCDGTGPGREPCALAFQLPDHRPGGGEPRRVS